MLNLYESYYKLSADPFRLSPDHNFAYGHQGYANARAYLEYAFFQGEGFVMVTGEPGTGKTTLINEILAGLNQSQMKIATLTTTQLDTRDLLHMVAVLFGMRVSEVSKPALLMDLKKHLTELAERGWRCILVVDEAQGLSPSGLEELRLLANLQHKERLLIQICLIGQDQLRDLVHTPQMEHLRQRIIAAAHLKPLTLEETVDYVEHRLCHAGWKGDPSISEGALRQIHRHSGGIPRLINLICNRLFLFGGLESRHSFKNADALQVIGELQQEQLLERESGLEADDAPGEATDLDASDCELSLPRFESVSLTVRTVSEEVSQASPVQDAHVSLATGEGEAASAKTETPAATAREADLSSGFKVQEPPAEPAAREEPYISSALRNNAPDEQFRFLGDEAAEEPEPGVGHTRRIAAVLILVAGLALVILFGSGLETPFTGRLKAEWLRFMAPESKTQTSTGESNAGATLPPVPASQPVVGAVERLSKPQAGQLQDAPHADVPIDDVLNTESIAVASLPAETPAAQLPAPPESAATGLVAIETAGTTAPAEDDWPTRLENRRLELEDKARRTFDRRLRAQWPELADTLQARHDAFSPPVSTNAGTHADQTRREPVAFNSLEPGVRSAEEARGRFQSLRDVHATLLDGRWSVGGEPAALLPSEITFCGQGDRHTQISCWSVPQTVKEGDGWILSKFETVLRGFSSQGDFELVYRALRAPAESAADPAWSVTEHSLWCEFSTVDHVSCAEHGGGNARVEFHRAPLLNDNSVRLLPRSRSSG